MHKRKKENRTVLFFVYYINSTLDNTFIRWYIINEGIVRESVIRRLSGVHVLNI